MFKVLPVKKTSTCFISAALLVLPLFLYAQPQSSPFLLPYQSPQNKYYWKNNPPGKDYWQQDVKYEIKAIIDDKNDVVSSDNFKLTYTNNSPDTLNELFFHLYENAFQPGSYYHELWKGNKAVPKFGKKEAQKLGTLTDNWKVNGQGVTTELDNTILKVYLNQPLLPGASLEVNCSFATYWDQGSMRRRNKSYSTMGFKHYDGVHWYPIVCIYDTHFGWHTDQHLDKEFYADFGSFDVELTFPQEYVVEATGVLKNREEVLPDTLRQKLDLKNFKDKPLNSKPSIITPTIEGKTKTWKYYAVNVHNFAFTADPTYRIGEVDFMPANGEPSIKVIAMAQEPHAAKWQPSAAFTARIMDIYTQDFGEYIWPKIIIADANDGMEYAMLTLDGGLYPQHQSLLAHEVGHMWFYGMLGSNETYRASLDEGFTQFLTIWSTDKLTGKKRLSVPIGSGKFIQKHIDSTVNRYERLYNSYLTDVWTGYDEPLNTHSSGFNSAIRQGGGYRLAYAKTGTMLYNLRYVLGDSLFLGAMKHYVKKWTGKHPYPEDFRKAITEYTKADLTWFFDQWMETTKYIDYKIGKVRKVTNITIYENGLRKKDTSNTYDITFKRLGRMQMPLDFTVSDSKGKKYNYYIPNTWFVKKTNATVLPKWYGWDWLQPTYTATVTIAGKIRSIEIDTTHQMADINLSNNKKWDPKDKAKMDYRVPNPPNWERVQKYIRPALWWNQYDGFLYGINLQSNYFGQNFWHESTFWLSSGWAQSHIPAEDKDNYSGISAYHANKLNLSKYWKQMFFSNEVYRYGGLWKYTLGLEKTFRQQDLRNPRYTKFYIEHGIMYRKASMGENYLLYPGYWSTDKINSYFNAGVQRFYSNKFGNGDIALEARTGGIASDFNYSYVHLTHIHNYTVGKFDLKSRFYLRVGMGGTPIESALYLAGAAPEQLFSNRLTRAAGFVPSDWLGYGVTTNHFHAGGGLNIRGYAGYLAPYDYGTTQINNYVGKSGTSMSIEIDFDRLVNFKPAKLAKYVHIDTYLFHDMGFLTYTVPNETKQKIGSLRTSSGLGAALTLKPGALNMKPFVLRFDMPLLLNTPPDGEGYFQFRYVVGVNRSF